MIWSAPAVCNITINNTGTTVTNTGINDGGSDNSWYSSLTFGNNGMHFFENRSDFLHNTTVWLDNFTNFLNYWSEDFMENTMWFIFGLCGLDLSGGSWSVNLLDKDWAGNGSEDYLHGLFTGLHVNDLWNSWFLWEKNRSHFISSFRMNGSVYWSYRSC
jgi:hypothetical protein